MLGKVSQETIDKVQNFINEHTHQELIEDEKKILKELFRGMVRFNELSSYSMDYSEEDFRIGLVQDNCEEHILYVKR